MRPAGRLKRACAVVVLPLLAVLILVAAGPPAGGQQPPPTAPESPTSSTGGLAPPAGGDLDGDGGSPLVYVALSVLGGTTAVAIMAVQWFRTRPGGHRSS